MLITPGDEELTADRRWRERIAQMAREAGIRLIGPDSMGIMRPSIGLNVSYWPHLVQTGSIGLLCQSGAVTAAKLADILKRLADGTINGKEPSAFSRSFGRCGGNG